MSYDKLYAIQYPSGSFGHFTHLILSNFGENFVREEKQPVFAKNGGNSHFTSSKIRKFYRVETYKKYAETKLYENYITITDDKFFTTVLIDSGIGSDTDEFLKYFPGCKYVRIVYDDFSWPLSAKAFYTRCMSHVHNKNMNIEDFIKPEMDLWDSNDDWVVREKYFLFLKDHEFRHKWRPNKTAINIPVTSYLEYSKLKMSIPNTSNFHDLYNSFYSSNKEHFIWFASCVDILNALKLNEEVDLSHITDLFSQATINYYVHLLFDFEIPAWDFKNWFSNTKEILDLVGGRKYN